MNNNKQQSAEKSILDYGISADVIKRLWVLNYFRIGCLGDSLTRCFYILLCLVQNNEAAFLYVGKHGKILEIYHYALPFGGAFYLAQKNMLKFAKRLARY